MPLSWVILIVEDRVDGSELIAADTAFCLMAGSAVEGFGWIADIVSSRTDDACALLVGAVVSRIPLEPSEEIPRKNEGLHVNHLLLA